MARRYLSLVCRLPFVALIVLSLSSCHPAAPPGQVVVTGDGFEITVAELDEVLKQAPAVAKESVAPTRRVILNALIDQKLLAQAAIDGKLDTAPATVQAIEAAKRAILAQAYAARLVGTPALPSERDIRHYYDQHPERFARNSRIRLRALAVPIDDPKLAAYRARFDADGLVGIVGQVMVGGVPIQPVTETFWTDGVPVAQGRMLLGMGAGEKIAYQRNGFQVLGEVEDSEVHPVPYEEAENAISRQLTGERAGAVVASAAAGLRQQKHVKIVNTDLQRGVR